MGELDYLFYFMPAHRGFSWKSSALQGAFIPDSQARQQNLDVGAEARARLTHRGPRLIERHSVPSPLEFQHKRGLVRKSLSFHGAAPLIPSGHGLM